MGQMIMQPSFLSRIYDDHDYYMYVNEAAQVGPQGHDRNILGFRCSKRGLELASS